MSKTRILVLKYDKTNWDIISEDGYFIYSYLDDEDRYIKIQRYSEKIKEPAFSYFDFLERCMSGDCYIQEFKSFSTMNNRFCKSLANTLVSDVPIKLGLITHSIPKDKSNEHEMIAKTLINEFLFGNTQKASCPTCAKERVFALMDEKEGEVKMCTECRTVL
ncbi:MAG: hypothetical protein ACTSRT_18490 [Promethearchaeota archaeon]